MMISMAPVLRRREFRWTLQRHRDHHDYGNFGHHEVRGGYVEGFGWGAPIMEDTSVVARALSFHGNKHGCRRRVDAGK